MPGANTVIMVGNLTADPQLSYTPNQTAVADVGLAVNRKYKIQGEKHEETCFIDVRCFAGAAEALAKYTRKGSLVYVQGYLTFERWEDKKDKKPHSRHRLIAERVQFLSTNGRDGRPREPGEEDVSF